MVFLYARPQRRAFSRLRFQRQAEGKGGALPLTAVQRDGAVVIDVGVNRDPETGKLCGDVDFAAIEPKASVITPVPGGVGPMTIAMLMANTVKACRQQTGA